MPSHSIPAFMALQLPFQGKAFLFWCAYQTERHAVVILCRKMEHVNKNKSTKCVCVCVWNYIHALVCGSQSRKWPGCTEFQISLMACSLAGNSSCPLVCPCHLLWRGGTCGWEEGDPLILRSFRLTLWFTRKWKKYIVFHHWNYMVPYYRQRNICLLCYP